jgi:hypothetical protein
MLKTIGDNTEIDANYISCAEYQLFIDDKIKNGKYCQPDHWKSLKHAPEDADKPITGIRASDAEEFCVWLTQRETRPGYKYRLPTLDEVNLSRSPINHIGCWCTHKGNHMLAGIEPRQWRAWQEELIDLYNLECALECNSSLELEFLINLHYTWHLDSPYLHLRILAVCQEFVQDFARELYQINRPTRRHVFIPSRINGLASLAVNVIIDAIAVSRGIINSLYDTLIYIFREIVIKGTAMLASAMSKLLALLRDGVLQGLGAIFQIVDNTAVSIQNLVHPAIQAQKKDYNPAESIEQILKNTLARSAEFDRFCSLAVATTQSGIRTKSRSRVNRPNRKHPSIYSLLLSTERDYFNSFRQKLIQTSSICKSSSSLEYLYNLKLDLSSVFDFDVLLDSAVPLAINRDDNFDWCNLQSIWSHLLTITNFYALLSRDYKKEVKQRRLLQYQHLSFGECKQLSEKYELRNNDVFKLSILFFLVTKRYERKLDAWEGIRIARVKTED